MGLDSRSWEESTDSLYESDREISRDFVKEGTSHYAIKYNPFMGVISDYFTAEN